MAKPTPSEKEIFAEALRLSTPEERAAYLAKACGDDAQLRQRIEALFEAHEEAGEFLQKPPAGVSAKTLVITTGMIPVTEKPGDMIGRYKLREQIGEGGCGVVYVAEQEEPVRRRVALKVIKLGMDTKQVVARFEAERQALALMDHPNIAKVLDAGATDTGRPYFVMELVRGIKITDYCDKNNLSTEERLKLFIQVCSATQHAHQKGIIHRDIKPSNILVTLHDGMPVPKVIDFGIAKATTDQRLTDKTVYTAFEQFLGTPAYMSPEQAEMSGLDIDTRSDIYSLGVLLYELLTGRTPFDAATLLKAGLDQMRRIIREQEPQRPSTRLSTLEDADLTEVANHRHAEPPKLLNLIRGDLDWIVMKSLEKDRTRRFETVNALAMDVKRHLENEPVVARPPSQLYRLQKVIQRNKLAFAAASSVLAALFIGLSLSTWFFLKEKQAHQRAAAAEREQSSLRDQAETERERAETEKSGAQVESRKARREKDRADEQAGIALDTLQHMKIQRAEDLFKVDNTSLALAMLAQVLRQNLSNRVAAERIMAALTQRNFLLPRIPLLNSNRVAEFSPDGRRLATVDVDHQLSIRDAHTGQISVGPIPIASTMQTLEFSPDGKQLLTASSNRVSVWNAADLVRQQESVPFSEPFYAAHFTPQGPRVISVQGSTVSVLDGLNGIKLVGPLQSTYTNRYNHDIKIATFSQDGNRLIVCSENSEIRVWNATNGSPITELLDSGGAGPSLALSPDGFSIVAGSQGAYVGHIYDTQIVPPNRRVLDNKNIITCVDFSRDGRCVATGGGDGIARIWEAATGKLITNSIHLDGVILNIQFDQTGRRIITSSTDGTIRLWDARNGQPASEALRNWPDKVHMSPDGGSVLLISDTDAQVWDLRLGRALAEPEWKADESDEDHISPDGRLEVRLYGKYNGNPTQARIFDRRTQKPVSDMLVFSENVFAVQFSPDSQRLVLGIGLGNGVARGRAEVFDARTGKRLMELPVDEWAVQDVAFSSDGRLIATGEFEGKARVWDGQTGNPITEPLDTGGSVKQVTFSPDGSFLLTVDRHQAAVWNSKTGTKVLTLQHDSNVFSAYFSPDGTLIVTAGADRAARIWEVNTGRVLHDLRHEAAVVGTSFSPDGKKVATVSRDHITRVWDTSTGQQIMEPLVTPSHGQDYDWSSLRFTDGGKRLRVQVRNSVLDWDVPDSPVPAPLWLADLAEAVGGQGFGHGMQVEPVSPRKLFALKERIQADKNSNADPYVRWAKWFFADRTARNISPLSKTTVRDYLEKCTEKDNTKSFDLDAAEQLDNGDTELRQRISLAGERLRQITHASALREHASALYRKGSLTEAEIAYREALAIRRKLLGNESLDVANVLGDLAQMLGYGQNKFAESETLYREALAIRRKLLGKEHQEVTDTLDALASVLQAQGKCADAEGPLREVFAIHLGSLDSSYADVISRLAFVLRQQGKLPEVQTLYGEVMKVGGESILNDLAWDLATSHNPELRDYKVAVLLAERAVALTNRKNPNFLDTLAAAYAEAGQFQNAVTVQKEAISLLQSNYGNDGFISRLKLYEANTPYR